MAKDRDKTQTMSELERYQQESDLRQKFEGLCVSELTVGELVAVLTLFNLDLAVVNTGKNKRDLQLQVLEDLYKKKVKSVK